MRWDDLFTDLAAQAEQLSRLELEGEIDERTRAQVGRIGVIDRLRGSVGSTIAVRCVGGALVTGVLTRLASEWLLLDEGDGREAVVPVAGILAASGLARLSGAPESATALEGRLGLRYVLRGIARDRSSVRIHLSDGHILDGTLDRVGSDFVELAEHASGEPRRRAEVRRTTAVAMSAIAVLRREV